MKFDERKCWSATKNSIDPINFVLNKYVSVKKVNQYKLRFKKKKNKKKQTGITSGIQKLIYIKKTVEEIYQ